ncbi:ParA family protein [Wenzhouxiangella limi]|uniref:ParA family protein n=1 Tax=Wenzhouxiangella limi TaxID=2707351 RepID=A0A845V535_9GAMM|nr:ParA family protein [Wenzhouxiangella limi]NDY95331.1 ParA family protein [Wenzhouxiangella limi]
MKTWVVANQKGGVGKTTVAVTLGGWLVDKGKRVLLVDMDPQCSLSAYFGFEPDRIEASVYDLFTHPDRDPSEVVVASNIDGIDVLPATPAMATLDRQLGQRQGQGLVLSRALRQLAEGYSHALVDCSPSLGVLMVNALAAADRVLVPTQTEYMALKGLERMLRTLTMINRSRSTRLPCLIIPTMFDRRTRASVGALEELRQQHGDELWREVIPVDTQFREASRNGLPLPQHLPQSRGAQAFRQLLSELLAAEAAGHDEEAA